MYRDTVWIHGEFYNPKTNMFMDSVRRAVYVSHGGGNYMGIAGRLNDNADVTAPVDSYWPNGYGLYNMSGNVEEMVDAYYNRTFEKKPPISEHRERSVPHPFTDVVEVEVEAKAEDPSGVTRGGSWMDTGYYAQVWSRQYYSGKDFTSCEIGFRLVLEIVEH